LNPINRFSKWLVIVSVLLALVACGASPAGTPVPAGCVAGGPEKEVTLDSGLKYADLLVCEGRAAQKGDTVSVNYVGMFTDGKEFDSSANAGRPFQFQLGAQQVIAGWDLGLVGMKVGSKRRLIIPPNLGYGSTGQGSIPPNATLVFDVELVSIP
jgi:peptidylprolyl isomerase